MVLPNSKNYATLGQAFAFLGSSLLAPMNQTERVGLSKDFWEAFPTFGSRDVQNACDRLSGFVKKFEGTDEDDAVSKVSVEWTHLFVGPPSPAAAPWETFYRGEAVEVGFGQATIQMRELLKEASLRVQNKNNQYEDHIGIELLYLSHLCADAEEAAGDESAAKDRRIKEFVQTHPAAWIDGLIERVEGEAPAGYISGLLQVSKALLALW